MAFDAKIGLAALIGLGCITIVLPAAPVYEGCFQDVGSKYYSVQ